MGWEALLFQKPVVTFGDVFFNMHPSVYQAGLESKEEWYNLFCAAIYQHNHDEEKLLELVAAIRQTAHSAFFRNPNTFPDVTEPSNIANLARVLAQACGLGERSAASPLLEQLSEATA